MRKTFYLQSINVGILYNSNYGIINSYLQFRKNNCMIILFVFKSAMFHDYQLNPSQNKNKGNKITGRNILTVYANMIKLKCTAMMVGVSLVTCGFK